MTKEDKSKKTFSTGEISKQLQITFKTLRYYDDIGLLQPKYRNLQNGYRYYDEDDIAKLLGIKYLQSSGIPLSKIKTFFQIDDFREIISFFDETIREREAAIRNEEIAKDNLIAWKTLLSEGEKYLSMKKIPFEIKKMREIKTHSISVSKKTSQSLRDEADSESPILYGPAYLEIESLESFLAGEETLRFRHMEINPRCLEGNDYSVLGGYPVASGIHRGPHDRIIDTYKKLLAWTEQQRLAVRGTAIERAVIDVQTTADVNRHITEIMLPLLPQNE
ncbi:MAG: MerR family transcriptional regulator [Bacillota bacterium]|jgi:DNA-binding transcriptional MerR regulator